MSIIPQRWVVTRSQVTSVLLNPIYLDEPSLNWTHNWYYSLPPPPWNASCPAFLTFLLLLFPANYSLLSFYGSFPSVHFLNVNVSRFLTMNPFPFHSNTLCGGSYTLPWLHVSPLYTHIQKLYFKLGFNPEILSQGSSCLVYLATWVFHGFPTMNRMCPPKFICWKGIQHMPSVMVFGSVAFGK